MAMPQKGDQVRATTYMMISLVLAGVVASGLRWRRAARHAER
jgi:hypothetical protein